MGCVTIGACNNSRGSADVPSRMTTAASGVSARSDIVPFLSPRKQSFILGVLFDLVIIRGKIDKTFLAQYPKMYYYPETIIEKIPVPVFNPKPKGKGKQGDTNPNSIASSTNRGGPGYKAVVDENRRNPTGARDRKRDYERRDSRIREESYNDEYYGQDYHDANSDTNINDHMGMNSGGGGYSRDDDGYDNKRLKYSHGTKSSEKVGTGGYGRSRSRPRSRSPRGG